MYVFEIMPTIIMLLFGVSLTIKCNLKNMEKPILNFNDFRLHKIYFNTRDSKVYLIIWLESSYWELTCKVLTRASINKSLK